MTKHKKPNIQILKLRQNLKTQIVTKLKNSNCDKTQKLKLWQNSKVYAVTKLKNSNGYKTQKLKSSPLGKSDLKSIKWLLKPSYLSTYVTIVAVMTVMMVATVVTKATVATVVTLVIVVTVVTVVTLNLKTLIGTKHKNSNGQSVHIGPGMQRVPSGPKYEKGT